MLDNNLGPIHFDEENMITALKALGNTGSKNIIKHLRRVLYTVVSPRITNRIRFSAIEAVRLVRDQTEVRTPSIIYNTPRKTRYASTFLWFCQMWRELQKRSSTFVWRLCILCISFFFLLISVLLNLLQSAFEFTFIFNYTFMTSSGARIYLWLVPENGSSPCVAYVGRQAAAWEYANAVKAEDGLSCAAWGGKYPHRIEYFRLHIFEKLGQVHDPRKSIHVREPFQSHQLCVLKKKKKKIEHYLEFNLCCFFFSGVWYRSVYCKLMVAQLSPSYYRALSKYSSVAGRIDWFSGTAYIWVFEFLNNSWTILSKSVSFIFP